MPCVAMPCHAMPACCTPKRSGAPNMARRAASSSPTASISPPPPPPAAALPPGSLALGAAPPLPCLLGPTAGAGGWSAAAAPMMDCMHACTRVHIQVGGQHVGSGTGGGITGGHNGRAGVSRYAICIISHHTLVAHLDGVVGAGCLQAAHVGQLGCSAGRVVALPAATPQCLMTRSCLAVVCTTMRRALRHQQQTPEGAQPRAGFTARGQC